MRRAALLGVLLPLLACRCPSTPKVELGPLDGGADGGVDAGMDGGVDGGADAQDGGLEPSDAGPEGGADAGDAGDGGVDAGFDGGQGLDAGLDAGVDAGPDAGADAGFDAGLDAGSDAGGDAGLDAGTDAGPADAGIDGGPVPLGVVCDALADATCRWSLRCGQLDPAQFAECLLLQGWTCSQPQASGVVDGGRLAYDATSARACVEALVQSDCARSFPAAAACGSVFSPSTPLGGGCTRQWQSCVGGYCASNACPSTCVAHLPLDGGCTGQFGDECGPNAYCRWDAPRVCVPVLSAGSPCAPNDRCRDGTCDSVQLRCVNAGSLGLDAGCGSDFVCSPGSYCRSGACAVQETLGGPCRIYGGEDCAPSFTCRIDGGTYGNCVPRSGVDGGCYGLPRDCLDGLVCSSPALFEPGVCLGFEGEGAACLRAVQNCKVGLVCDATAHCLRLPRVGEPCERDPLNFRGSDCAGGFCGADAGQCAPPQDAGAPCALPWECASTYCEAGACVEACVP